MEHDSIGKSNAMMSNVAADKDFKP